MITIIKAVSVNLTNKGCVRIEEKDEKRIIFVSLFCPAKMRKIQRSLRILLNFLSLKSARTKV